MAMPLRRSDDEVLRAVGLRHRNQPIVIVDLDRDDAGRARVRERRQVGLLDGAVPRAHHDEALAFFGRELLHAQQRGELLALGHVHEIRDRLALAAPADFGHVVHAQPVAPAAVREDQDVGVRVGDEEVRDDILFARLHADQALAAAPLLPVRVERGALDVARVRRGDDDVLVGDEVLDPELAALFDEVRAPLVAVLRRESASARRRRCR